MKEMKLTQIMKKHRCSCCSSARLVDRSIKAYVSPV